MKYITIILSAGVIILFICFIICKRQVTRYQDILSDETSLVDDVMSIDSLEALAQEIKRKNKLKHSQDLHRIDSLCLHIEQGHYYAQLPESEAYSDHNPVTIIKDTLIYNHIPKDTLVYIVKYVTDTIYRQVEIVDTIYKKVKRKRKK